MKDAMNFDNDVYYMVVGPSGTIENNGTFKNACGLRSKDMVMRAFSSGSYHSSLEGCKYLYFRCDNNTLLGVGSSYVLEDSSTIFSTRFGNATYCTAVGFNGTKTATAQITIKTVAITDTTVSGGMDMGSYSRYYSTNLNVTLGSASKLILNWTISL